MYKHDKVKHCALKHIRIENTCTTFQLNSSTVLWEKFPCSTLNCLIDCDLVGDNLFCCEFPRDSFHVVDYVQGLARLISNCVKYST